MSSDSETTVVAPVLVGMSMRDVTCGDELARLADSVAGSVAFLQLGDPSLSTELTRRARAGAERVTLVGVNLGTGAPAISWLRRIAGHWVRRCREAGDTPPAVHAATTMIRTELTVNAVTSALEVTRPVTGDEAGLTSAAWEEVPGYRHQVLLCRGPRCTARGSEDTAEKLRHDLRVCGALDDHVLITQTGCLFPCNHAPVVAVQPDDVWYSHVDPEAASRIAEEHLLGGDAVKSHHLPRRATYSAPDRD